MPPVRTRMASIKPMKTERTHEENQERAYIAASRRNDRSLEARVESARRASETHKRRTGHSLRVTEQDVINEEMYEEEDDDLPMQYRRLTAHLQTQNADFSQRLQSYVINQMAMRQAVSNAAIDGMLMNNGQVQPLPLMNINPGYMTQVQQQQQQSGFQQGSMMPPQMYNRTRSNYRQQPYPIPQHNMQPSYHSDALSVANAQSLSQFEQQQSQSGQTSPVETKPTADDRRMSLPVYSATAFSQWGQVPSPSHGSPDVSRTGSSSSTVTPAAYIQQSNSYQQVPTPPETKPQQRQESRGYPQQQDLVSPPFAPSFEQQLNGSVNPFTLTLPMEAQPMLAGSSSLDPRITTPTTPTANPATTTPTTTIPSTAPDGTRPLMVPPFDTNLIACDTYAEYNSMADPTATYTPSSTPQWGYGMGFDSGYRSDIFKTSSSSEGSGNATPQEADFGAMLNIPAEALGPDEGVLA
ncbi:hypothetical protein LTR02_017089 [Friedmanniomyces endolithicus]|nr:hypothetical protein LTR94_022092 [Friedmanniomyces endolithicus]KAK0768879.1 hypothetical protein LTR59_017367 [Friedmanniomyces endolithicus]KAK0771052.1 hypothetical protein LTR38_017362 [Friedmanniomyces endolithicus]KAK0773280.1 hypothetical protein LTR75_017174 [Friedmanniomyces endolithicus]KAK0826038.1 hypothetical protein LTR03_017294 [Friedmanniomyces endolithicus]